MRTTAEKRHNDWKKAIRKRRIDRERSPNNLHDWYDNLHQYSKNKIHCSCPMCRGGYTKHGENNISDIIHNADTMMYSNKNSNR